MESQVQVAPKTRRPLRRLGWVAIASLLAVGALATSSGGSVVSAVTATTSLKQTTPISYTDPAFQGDAGECAGVVLQPGQVLWHFVLTQTSSGTAGSYLHATFSGGLDVDNVLAYKKAGGVLHWSITTGTVSLTGAHTNRAGKNLVLSHICQGPPETTTTETTSTETTSTETTTTEETTTEETTQTATSS